MASTVTIRVAFNVKNKTSLDSVYEQPFIDLLSNHTGITFEVTLLNDNEVAGYNYANTELLVIRSPGNLYEAHPSNSSLNNLSVNILSLCVYTARYAFSMTSGYSTTTQNTIRTYGGIRDHSFSINFPSNTYQVYTSSGNMRTITSPVNDVLVPMTAGTTTPTTHNVAGIRFHNNYKRSFLGIHTGNLLNANGQNIFINAVCYTGRALTIDDAIIGLRNMINSYRTSAEGAGSSTVTWQESPIVLGRSGSVPTIVKASHLTEMENLIKSFVPGSTFPRTWTRDDLIRKSHFESLEHNLHYAIVTCHVCNTCEGCNNCDSCNTSCNQCDICLAVCNACNACNTFCNACNQVCVSGCYTCDHVCEMCNVCNSCNNVCNDCDSCNSSCNDCNSCHSACDGSCDGCNVCATGCDYCNTFG
jgi:hypothetical protein